MLTGKDLIEAHVNTTNTIPTGGKIVIAVIGGSHSYGLAHADSDIDVRGVYQLPVSHFTGVTPPVTTFETDEPMDVSLKEIAQYVKLLANGNPHIMETLWAPFSCRIVNTDGGQLLLDARDEFVTVKSVRSYLGYLKGQIDYAQRMGEDHRRYPKTKRHIVRLISAASHLIETGTPLVQLPDHIQADVRLIPECFPTEAEFFWYASDRLMALDNRTLYSFKEEVDEHFQNDLIQTIRNTARFTP